MCSTPSALVIAWTCVSTSDSLNIVKSSIPLNSVVTVEARSTCSSKVTTHWQLLWRWRGPVVVVLFVHLQYVKVFRKIACPLLHASTVGSRLMISDWRPLLLVRILTNSKDVFWLQVWQSSLPYVGRTSVLRKTRRTRCTLSKCFRRLLHLCISWFISAGLNEGRERQWHFACTRLRRDVFAKGCLCLHKLF